MSRKDFVIPSLAEIKAANKITSKNEPSLFKSSASASSLQLQTQLTAASKRDSHRTVTDVGPPPTLRENIGNDHSSTSKQIPSLGKIILRNHRHLIIMIHTNASVYCRLLERCSYI